VKTYRVRLTDEERQALEALVRKGRASARELTRARILLKADEGSEEAPQGDTAGPTRWAWTDESIAAALDVSHGTVERVRKRAVLEGPLVAIEHRPSQRPPRRKLDGRAAAHLLALACGVHGPPGGGREGWTLRLLADKLVELEYVDPLSHETVRRILKKTNSSRT
jgi:hypothetical protein